MVSDPSSDAIVSWSEDESGLMIHNMKSFKKEVLPKYFRSTKFQSFKRQLNMYGFSKNCLLQVKGCVIYNNPFFVKGQFEQLALIKRQMGVQRQSEQSMYKVNIDGDESNT